MNTKKIYTALISYFTGMIAIAQTSGNLPLVTPQSPQAAAFSLYGEIPVNMATGIPQIDIPLMTISDKDITLDVSLSYHASGIKVDQEAAWVGLGWTLNAGGMITRQIKGMADGYGFREGRFEYRTSITDYDYTTTVDAYGAQVESSLYGAAGGLTDNEPDIFIYNFCGKSGKFFFDRQSKAHFANYEDMKVEYFCEGNPYCYSYFVITDDKGWVYEFRDTESTGVQVSSFELVTVGWCLSKITSPSGGKFEFTYKQGGVISWKKRLHDVCYMVAFTDGRSQIFPIEYKKNDIESAVRIYGIVPDKIIASSGNTIEFISSGNRKDGELMTNSNNLLDKIILRDGSNNVRKQYRFHYSYFEANRQHGYKGSLGNNYDPNNPLNFRLRLDSLRELSSENLPLAPYKFEYYGDNDPDTDDPYTLPYRLSPCQDHWGYYNHSNNITLFPSNPSNVRFEFDEWFCTISSGYGPFGLGGNEIGCGSGGINFSNVSGAGIREPDSEAVKASMLNKITYPTGGYTEFDFEAPSELYLSDGYNAGGVRIKQIKSHDNSGNISTKWYEYQPHYGTEYEMRENLYYTEFRHNYNPQISEPGFPELMMAFGIPEYLARNNNCVLRIDATSHVVSKLGANYYESVTEHIT